MKGIDIRLARSEDMAAICSIINHFVRTTWFNFRYAEQSEEEARTTWTEHRLRYPWLVAEVDQRVVGVAYAGPWKSREAYDWCAEVTVYTDADKHGKGIARSLYQTLFPILQAQGFRTLVAVIGLPNQPSVALHERFDFEHAGTLRSVGYKHDAWHDVGYWQRSLGPTDHPPAALRTVESALSDLLP